MKSDIYFHLPHISNFSWSVPKYLWAMSSLQMAVDILMLHVGSSRQALINSSHALGDVPKYIFMMTAEMRKSKQHISGLLSCCANGVWNCGLMLQSYTFLSPWWWLREAWPDLMGRVCACVWRWGEADGQWKSDWWGGRRGMHTLLQLSASFDLQEIGIEIMWQRLPGN